MKNPTFKNTLIDFIITAVLCVIQFYGMVILLLFSYGFYLCGNEYLNQWNNIRNGFVVSVVIFIVQILITINTYKLRTGIIKVSFWVITTSTLLPIFFLGRDTFNSSAFYEEFDSEKWNSSDEKPLKMIRVFYEDKRFIGKTRQDVINVLGKGINSWRIDDNEIGYTTDGFESPLVFTLKNDTVIKYELHCYD